MLMKSTAEVVFNNKGFHILNQQLVVVSTRSTSNFVMFSNYVSLLKTV